MGVLYPHGLAVHVCGKARVVYIYLHRRGVSALLVLTDWAMREAFVTWNGQQTGSTFCVMCGRNPKQLFCRQGVCRRKSFNYVYIEDSMTLYKHSFVLLLLLLCLSCSKDVVDTTGNIIGIVTDARTTEPLSGVGVTINPLGKTATTGADGRYEFKSVAAQDYNVQAKKANYQTLQKTVSVIPGEDSRLDFLLTPSTPNLVVTQNSFDFGNEQTTLSLDISNDGFAALDWQVSEDISWLSCLPTSGRVQAGEKTSVVLNVDRTGVNRGNYSQTLSISSNGGSKDIRIDMGVQGITVNVTPDQLDFGPVGVVKTLSIKNTGSGTVSYTLTTASEWLGLDATTGAIAPQATRQVAVSVDRTGLSEGDYSGNIVVNVGDHTIDVPVKMSISSKAKPNVYLSAVTGVTYSEARFSGAIVSIGSANVTRHGFCWSTAENPAIDNGAEFCNFGSASAAREFAHKAIGLTQATRYYVRAYAENDEGITYSNQEGFVTPGLPTVPEVVTGTVADIRSSQAQVTGTLAGLGNVESVTEHGHVWSTVPNPTAANSKTAFGTVWATCSFTSTLTGLQPNVTYHVRAYATNKKGTAYGEDVTFTTAYGNVVLTTSEATGITSKSATVSGTITGMGGHTITERGVCWATTSAPTLSDNSVRAITSNTTFTASLTGLAAETAYYVRAYARTATGGVFYGNAVSFTTPSKEVSITVGDYDTDDYWEK